MNNLDLETIKARAEHLSYCLEEAAKAETMQDRAQWYIRACTGWPSPADTLNRLIKAHEYTTERVRAVIEIMESGDFQGTLAIDAWSKSLRWAIETSPDELQRTDS